MIQCLRTLQNLRRDVRERCRRLLLVAQDTCYGIELFHECRLVSSGRFSVQLILEVYCIYIKSFILCSGVYLSCLKIHNGYRSSESVSRDIFVIYIYTYGRAAVCPLCSGVPAVEFRYI